MLAYPSLSISVDSTLKDVRKCLKQVELIDSRKDALFADTGSCYGITARIYIEVYNAAAL